MGWDGHCDLHSMHAWAGLGGRIYQETYTHDGLAFWGICGYRVVNTHNCILVLVWLFLGMPACIGCGRYIFGMEEWDQVGGDGKF